MLQFLKEYFSFSKGERNGLLVLLGLLAVLIAGYYLLPVFFEREAIDSSAFRNEIAEFEKQTAQDKDARVNADTSALALFEFDPNELPEEGWKKLGIDARTARTILNYRNKGGIFYEKKDLLKIYGLDTAKYEQLEPYIRIADEEKEMINPLEKSVYKPAEKSERTKPYPAKKEKPAYEPRQVELNSADSALLVTVNGIGPVLSKRIIKYRNRLGGFVRVEQMMEVYGMDSGWFESMKPSLWVDSTSIRKVLINSITQEELEKHPYFGRNLAKALCNYRQQHGAFGGEDDLKKIYVLDETLLQKILPYITFETTSQ